MRKKFIPFHVPLIEQEEIDEVVDTLKSGWLTSGPKTKRFETDFANYVGAKNAIAVNSCTAALHLALNAVGIKPGDEVIVPTFTFAATAEVVLYFGAKPVLVDCSRDTFNIDPKEIVKKITKKTKAIIPVHVGGNPCLMDEILDIAKKYKLKIVEDAAHALPAKYKSRMIGTIGDITAFSFYATKNITTGEGGMITTGNDKYAEKMEIMRLHGISRDAWKRYAKAGSWYYEILKPGYKYNLTDIQSSVGIHQLKKCDRLYRIRKRYAQMYTDGFKNTPEVFLPFQEQNTQHAWHLYIIKLDLRKLKINRDEFIEALKVKNIGVSVHFIPLHLHPYYRDTYGYKPGDFPNAKYLYERIISLPLYPKMTEEEIKYVISAVKSIIKENRSKDTNR